MNIVLHKYYHHVIVNFMLRNFSNYLKYQLIENNTTTQFQHSTNVK